MIEQYTDKPTLVVLAAGLSTRYGRPKQLEQVGPGGETLLDYDIYDAVRAGFGSVTFVIRREMESAFRRHASDLYGEAVPASYVFQDLDDLPPGFSAPSSRTKPWGTGHALLCAARAMSAPFAICNADDFYGARSFAGISRHLMSVDAGDPAYAMVTYELRRTVPGALGVSRGICELGPDSLLRSVAEVKGIRPEGDAFVGTTTEGERRALTGGEPTATGLFGLTPAVTSTLERAFRDFLAEHARDDDAEFLIGAAINRDIASDRATVKALPTDEPWIGMTHAEDRDRVIAEIRDLVDQGRYPRDLGSAFRSTSRKAGLG